MTNQELLKVEHLADAFLKAKTREIMVSFLKDILTEHEIAICVRRLFAAYQLAMGASYEFIVESTGLSPNTISRISKQMKDSHGGFNEALMRVYPDKFASFDGPDPLLEEFLKDYGYCAAKPCAAAPSA